MVSCELLNAYHDGDLSHEDKLAFEEHILQCPACGAAHRSWTVIEETVRDIAMEDGHQFNKPDEVTAKRIEDVFNRRNRTRAVRAGTWVAAAAALLVGVGLVAFVVSKPDNDGARVAKLEREPISGVLFRSAGHPPSDWHEGQKISIDEGMSALLKMDSAQLGMDKRAVLDISSDASGATLVTLQRGRVVAAVSPLDKDASFVVKSAGCAVRVLGTIFSVERARDDQTTVSVTRGTVEVLRDSAVIAQVTVGHRVVISGSGEIKKEVLVPEDKIEMERLLSDDVKAMATDPASRTDHGDGKASRDEAKATPPKTVALSTPGERRDWERLIIDGRQGEASVKIRRHLKTAPNDTLAWSLLADCEKRSGNWSSAVASYRNIMDRGNRSEAATARFQAAVLLQDKLGRQSDAAELLTTFAAENQRHPLVAEALLRRALALRAMGRAEESSALLNAITRNHPGSVAAIKARRLLGEENGSPSAADESR